MVGREADLKKKQHFSPLSLSDNSTNVPATCLERRLRTAQGNNTQGYAAHFRINHHKLLFGNWNALTLAGKELKFVEEAKKYYLDTVGVSATERRGSGIIT